MPDMVRMVSTSVHVYAGHRLHAGDEFDCEPQHVDLMKNLGRARVATVRPETQMYQTRDLVAEGRRDLVAEAGAKDDAARGAASVAPRRGRGRGRAK